MSRLYLDYVYAFPKVASFYGTNGWSFSSLAARTAAGVTGTPREQLCDVLADQNRSFGSGELTSAHLWLLRQPDTVAVVTGQQPGLFTGPLYTIYKALTAVKIAAALRARGLPAVPVFWIAGDDHDFAEINHCNLVSPEGELVTIRYNGPGSDGQPVGNLPLTSAIGDAIARLLAALPPSTLRASLGEQLRTAYASGVTIGAAFGRLLASVLSRSGLILLDSTDTRLKALVASLFETALERAPEIAAALGHRSSALRAAGYHAQLHVEPDAVPLFILHDGRRVALRCSGGMFWTRDGRERWRLGALRQAVRACPGAFSPNAGLRPVVQDLLLPTVAYVGGPAEVAYFAQLEPIYRLFGLPPTPVVPRASFTIVEHRDEKTLQKFEIRFPEIFAGFEQVWSNVVASRFAGLGWRRLEEAERIFSDMLQALEQAFRADDPSLAGAVSRRRQVILRHLADLRNRYLFAQRAREAAASGQLQRMLTRLSPAGHLQERELSVFHFVARYDYSFLDEVYQAIELDSADHRLLFPGPISYAALAAGSASVS